MISIILSHEDALEHPESRLYHYLVVEKEIQSDPNAKIPEGARHNFKDELCLEIKTHLDKSHVHEAIQEFYEKLGMLVDHDGNGFFLINDYKGDCKKTVFVSFIPSEVFNNKNSIAMIRISQFD